jgi:CheY-like chemotaxis protein
MDHILKRIVGEDIELLIEGNSGHVKVDPGQLEQVIVNLVVNARDAMPRGGKLVIRTTNQDFDQLSAQRPDGLQPGSYVLLTVSDTGVGIDAATRAHLFEPFFTTKERGRGTGLGLSTSYGIVKQNQGEILVQSEPGAGAIFKIYLPRVNDPLETEYKAPTDTKRYHGSETVLVVEDEEGVRRVLLGMLQQIGYRVFTAGGAQEAIDLCLSSEVPIQMLITDVVMPKMGGRELAERLRDFAPDLKVLFVSGYTGSAIMHDGVLDAGTHFLQKPFTVEQLAGKVREVLEG